MIFSIVLFLATLSLIVWQASARQSNLKKKPIQVENNLSKNASSTPSQKCDGCIRRLLDGIYVQPEASKAPLAAVMLDNHPDARPQAGIENASLVYEAEVEGGYTRFMAIFSDIEKAGQIGPVRSARPYFVDWAEELGAIYTHCGGSPEALVVIEQKGIVDLNEMRNGQYFWRAANRTAPHNILTSGENLAKFIKNKDAKPSIFLPWKFKDDTKTDNASTTEKIEIDFNHSNFAATWIYNKDKNDYTRYLGDKPYLTAGDNLIVAKNIIIQYIPAKVVDDKLRLEIKTVGSGAAIICLDGSCQKGEWTKKGASSRTLFGYEDGREVEFNAGNTWIEITRPEVSVTY